MQTKSLESEIAKNAKVIENMVVPDNDSKCIWVEVYLNGKQNVNGNVMVIIKISQTFHTKPFIFCTEFEESIFAPRN